MLCSKLNGSKDQQTNWCNLGVIKGNKLSSSGSYEEKILSVWVSFTVFEEVRDAILLLLTIGNFPSKEFFLVNRVSLMSLAYRWVGWSVDRSVIWSSFGSTRYMAKGLVLQRQKPCKWHWNETDEIWKMRFPTPQWILTHTDFCEIHAEKT